MTYGRGWLGFVCLGFVLSACGSPSGGPSGGAGTSGGGAGTGGGAGASGKAGTGAAGSNPDAAAGTGGSDHSVVVWPSFPPGRCAPKKPAGMLEGPGVVDTEDLCTRTREQVVPTIAIGEWGYGSIGFTDPNTKDPDLTATPDTDSFILDPPPEVGDILRATIEALPGQDFHPSGGNFEAPPGDPTHARREFLIAKIENSYGVYVFDARVDPAKMGAEAGAGAIYRVRVDRVTPTPVPLASGQVLLGDFGHEGHVGVYEFTLPAPSGHVHLEADTEKRMSNAAPSLLQMVALLYDPRKKTRLNFYLNTWIRDASIDVDFDPAAPEAVTGGVGIYYNVKPGTYWFMVDTPANLTTAAKTDYDVTAVVRGRPANDVCAGAIDVTPTAGATKTTMGETTYAVSDSELSDMRTSAACHPAAARFAALRGHDVVYSAVVPARKRLTAKVTPIKVDVTTWKPIPWIGTACEVAETSCVSLGSSPEAEGAETVAWTNPGAAPRTVYVNVDAETEFGPFKLETSFTDAPAAPANDVCGGVIALDFSSGQGYGSGDTSGATDEEQPLPASTSAACKDSSSAYRGGDVVYSTVVPAGKRLTFDAGSSDWDVALWLSETCAGAVASCLAAHDGVASTEKLAWTNTGATDKPVVIHVDSFDPIGGAFNYAARLEAPAAPDTCPGTPRDPATIYGGSTLSRYDDYVFTPATLSAACRTAITGPTRGADVVDSFVVPAGKTLSLAIKGTVSVNGKPVDDWVGFLTPVCGTAAESAAACVSAGAAPSWTNTGAAPQTIYLFLDRQLASPAQADFQVTPTLK